METGESQKVFRPHIMKGVMMNVTDASMMQRTMLVAAILLILILSLLTAQRPASASTNFTVNLISDEVAANLADGVCDVYAFAWGNQCTLRAAIEQANAASGTDTITFGLSGEGVHTIMPASQLPTIKEAVTIDGYSQAGSSVNTLAGGTNAKLAIQLDGYKTPDGSVGMPINAPDVVVKGLVIKGFWTNIWIGDFAANTRIEGNFVGTDPSGTQTPGTSEDGVVIYDQSGVTNHTVGGPDLADRNLISGNYTYGVRINTDGSRVSGNLIGTQRDGKSPLGNGYGVKITFGHDNVVGGATPERANTIAFNGDSGVQVTFDSLGNRIFFNSIFSNGTIGIDLGQDGRTANDVGDADSGENDLQNKPRISSATKPTSTRTVVKGKLNSTADQTFKIQFFSNPKGADEGKTFLGSRTTSTDGSGNLSFVFETKKQIGLGQNMTATATNTSKGDTSEFSAPVKVVAS